MIVKEINGNLGLVLTQCSHLQKEPSSSVQVQQSSYVM